MSAAFPYFSFLVCAHPGRAEVYLNGRQIGTINPDTNRFAPHVIKNPECVPVTVTLQQIAEQPFTKESELAEWLLKLARALGEEEERRLLLYQAQNPERKEVMKSWVESLSEHLDPTL